MFEENIKHIRNFVIIAHIDAGKSTLADRLLEITNTVDSRKMKPQYLDQLDLERERGITIKMAPVRMIYKFQNQEYILNLIDTPGHSDFHYEVSRALAAVEGAILLIDATQGIQAQTLANLYAAQAANLKIIGAINKIDLLKENNDYLNKLKEQTANLINQPLGEIHLISAKNGVGIRKLLEDVILKLPPPRYVNSKENKALIFDSIYDDNKGIIAYVKVFGGEFKINDLVKLFASNYEFKIKEVGYFNPEFKKTEKLSCGEIGYIATGIKEPSLLYVGDTISKNSTTPLPGYRKPMPVVFVSFYPEGNTTFEDLKKAFEKISLSDSSLTIETENNNILGRGLKVGFLGKLHFEIIATRLQREFSIQFFNTFPSIRWKVKDKNEEKYIYDPNLFPDKPENVWQPMVNLQIITPPQYLNAISKLQNIFEIKNTQIKTIDHQILVLARMPLLELIYDFDDKLKSVSCGFASFSYEINDEEKANVVKIEILINGQVIKPLTRIVPQKNLEKEARNMLLKIKDILPRQQFKQALQVKALGRIIARENIPAIRKDVTGYLYGGDRTRKMKLWQKQKEGKKKLKIISKINISPEIIKEILKK